MTRCNIFLWLPILIVIHLTPQAGAWDSHFRITRATLNGIETRDPSLWSALAKPIEVRPLTSFMTKAFGPHCDWNRMRDGVLEGLGSHYEVQYTEGVTYQFEPNWDTGDNRVRYDFLPSDPLKNNQAIGRKVTPASVLAIYSDEPDWHMDDDVPRLKEIGLAKGHDGTATRVLRHFWNQGETFPINLEEGQELDRRIQLFYELGLIAFSVGEPYWGFRYWANAMHYLQDLTQPFHVRGVPDNHMLYEFHIAQALSCSFWDRIKGPHSPAVKTCGPSNSIANATAASGWLLGSYHSMYEDFANGLTVSNAHLTREAIADSGKYREIYGPMDLPDFVRQENHLLDLRDFIRKEQKAILTASEGVGSLITHALGLKYRWEPTLLHQEILLSGKPQAVGFRLAAYPGSFGLEESEFSLSQMRAKEELAEATNGLLSRAGIWGRRLLTAAWYDATSPTPEQALAIQTLRARYARACQ